MKLTKITALAIFITLVGTLNSFALDSKTVSQNKVFSTKCPISIATAESSLNKAELYIKQNKFAEAEALLKSQLSWMEDVTEYHADLYKSLKSLDKAQVQADIEKDLAFKSAVLRDQFLFKIGVVYIKEGKLRQAADALVQVVKSQPETDLGYKAYGHLVEIGFTYKAQLTDNAPNTNQK